MTRRFSPAEAVPNGPASARRSEMRNNCPVSPGPHPVLTEEAVGGNSLFGEYADIRSWSHQQKPLKSSAVAGFGCKRSNRQETLLGRTQAGSLQKGCKERSEREKPGTAQHLPQTRAWGRHRHTVAGVGQQGSPPNKSPDSSRSSPDH